MAEKRRGLGRGLGALIPSGQSTNAPATGQGAGPSGRVGRPVDLFFAPGRPAEPEEEQRSDAAPEAASEKKPAAAAVKTARIRPSAADGKATEEDAAKADEAPKARAAKAGTASAGAAKTGTSKGQVTADPQTEKVGTQDKKAEARDKPDVVETAHTEAKGPADTAAEASSPVTDEAAAGGQEEQAATGGRRETQNPAVTSAPEPEDLVRQEMRVQDLEPIEAVSRETLVEVPGARFAEVPVHDIHPNRKQPRTVFDEDDMLELVHSVREIGILQPVVVRPSAEDGEPAYELVMGERRWRAAQKAGLESVPAIIRSTSDDDLLRDALLENLHRSQLNPLEEAAAYQQLLDDFGCTHDELADRIGRSRPQISNTLRLMKLPPLVQRRVAAGVLSAGHARALLALNDPAEMEKLAQRIVAEGLSVRATEEIVALADGLRNPTRERKARGGARHERLDYLANSLSDRLDTNVKITLGARKGKVSIEFASVDDLNRIMAVINPGAEG